MLILHSLCDDAAMSDKAGGLCRSAGLMRLSANSRDAGARTMAPRRRAVLARLIAESYRPEGLNSWSGQKVDAAAGSGTLITTKE